MSIQYAKDLAERIAVDEFGITEPPVDVKKIAKKYGLNIIEDVLEDSVAGLLITQGSKAFCVLNRSDARTRKRFTIGHELGHHILKHQQQSGEHVHVDRGNFISMRRPRSWSPRYGSGRRPDSPCRLTSSCRRYYSSHGLLNPRPS